MELLNTELVTQTLNFHGQQLQKIWEAEFGDQDLANQNVTDVNFEVYNKRSKHLTFQDRGKRLKLQHFIVKKAPVLFSNDVLKRGPAPEETVITEDMYAIMPPLEMYFNVDKQKRLKYFFQVSFFYYYSIFIRSVRRFRDRIEKRQNSPQKTYFFHYFVQNFLIPINCTNDVAFHVC